MLKWVVTSRTNNGVFRGRRPRSASPCPLVDDSGGLALYGGQRRRQRVVVRRPSQPLDGAKPLAAAGGFVCGDGYGRCSLQDELDRQCAGGLLLLPDFARQPPDPAAAQSGRPDSGVSDDDGDTLSDGERDDGEVDECELEELELEDLEEVSSLLTADSDGVCRETDSSSGRCSDSVVQTKVGKQHNNRLWLHKQIDREQRLRTGAEKLLQATSNERLKLAIVAELSSINRNLQTMKEDLVELSRSLSASDSVTVSRSYGVVSATNCSPMLSLHLKQTKDVNFKSSLVHYIASHYYEDGERYSEQLNRLTEMRRICCMPACTDASIENLFVYYNQLYFVDRRFFPPNYSSGSVIFDWYDAFSGIRTSQKSIAFEKGSILFNIAALYAQKGARQNRHSVAGLEAAAADFRSCAGSFRCLRDSFLHAPSRDMQPPTVDLLILFSLAQARECLLERSLLLANVSTSNLPSSTDEERTGITSRCVELAQEAASLSARYSEVERLLSTEPLSTYLPLVWTDLSRAKRIYYDSLARYYIATALLSVPVINGNRSPRDTMTFALVNAHSRVVDKVARHSVYSDSLVETIHGRTLLAKAHIRQSILASEEALKIVTSQSELHEFYTVLQKFHDRSLRKFSELDEEDDFTELLLAPDVSARSKLQIEPVLPDFAQYKVGDLFHKLGCLTIFSARHEWTPPRLVTLSRRADEEFGFNIRGESPVIVATVDDCSLAQSAGVHVGDFIVAVGDEDVKWTRHDAVVALIRKAGATVRLSLITPIDRNYIEPAAASTVQSPDIFNNGPQPESTVSRLDDSNLLDNGDLITTETDPLYDSKMETSKSSSPSFSVFSRHWANRRKRGKNT